IRQRFMSLRSAIATALKAGVAAGAVGAVYRVRTARDAASDLNEATHVTGLIFKPNRGETARFVRASFRLGLAEAQARELTGQLGGLLENLGLAPKLTVAWSKRLLTLGADLGSAFNREPAEAVEAIGGALRGETEPIRRFNVVINEAAIQQEALRLG